MQPGPAADVSSSRNAALTLKEDIAFRASADELFAGITRTLPRENRAASEAIACRETPQSVTSRNLLEGGSHA